MARVPNGVETLPKISTGLSRAHERCRRQATGGRATAFIYEFTFAKNKQNIRMALCEAKIKKVDIT